MIIWWEKFCFLKKRRIIKRRLKLKSFFLKKMKKLGKVADPRKYETKNFFADNKS